MQLSGLARRHLRGNFDNLSAKKQFPPSVSSESWTRGEVTHAPSSAGLGLAKLKGGPYLTTKASFVS